MIDACLQPSFGRQAAGTTHTSLQSYPSAGFGGGTSYAQEAHVGWLRWHFMGDPAARAWFTGDSRDSCTRQGLTMRTKGIN